MIQYAVEEAAAAGITDMIFITGRNKRAIEDHFDKAYELETELALRHKMALLEQVQAATPRGINCVYIRQTEALGLGHAVLCAEPVVADEPFAVLLADDLIDAPVPVMKQMVDLAARENASAIGVMNVAADETGSYGIVEADGEPAGERIGRITRIVEKPKAGTSPSTLAVVGRYVLSPRIFHHLRTMPPGAGGEIQLTDGIARCCRKSACWPTSSKAAGTIAAASSATSKRRSITGCSIAKSARRSRVSSPVATGEAPAGHARLRRLAAMTLNELRYVVAVAQERSFGRAAAKCFVSQPALSVAIQKLEEELGAPLFERGKTEITITPIGERIVEQAQKVLEEAARIREIAIGGRNQLVGHAAARRSSTRSRRTCCRT